MALPRFYHAHETAREDRVDGLRLASFWQRALGFAIDFALMLAWWAVMVAAWRYFVAHTLHGHTALDFRFNLEAEESLLFLFAYFAVTLFVGKGQTPGKWVARTRVVSLTHDRVGLWQSIERALGYGASLLELGFGFVQFFMNRNRQTVHDRIAETIVVDCKSRD